MQKTAENLAEGLPFWQHLTGEERVLAASRVVQARFAAGQLIRGGEEMDCLGFIVVLAGVLRASLLSPDGREVTLYRLKEGDACVLAASCVLDAVSFDTQITAEEDCEVLVLPVDVYASLMDRNIHVELDSYKMATERFSDVVTGVERLVFLNIEQRLVSFLLDEAADRGSDELRMTHEQIAVNIGSAREVVSRALKNLSKRGLVELSRGGIHIKNKSALYQSLA